MKKLKLSLALLCSVLSLSVYAQQEDQVTLNVRLYPIQTIKVNTSQQTVNLDYKTVNDYAGGVEVDEANHLTVYSTGGFVVKVRAKDAAIKRQNGNETIQSAGISVKAAKGTNDPLENATTSLVSLTTSAQDLIKSNTGGVNKNFDVSYKAEGADAYVNKYFKDENPTIYSTTVMYSIEAM